MKQERKRKIILANVKPRIDFVARFGDDGEFTLLDGPELEKLRLRVNMLTPNRCRSKSLHHPRRSSDC